MFNYIIKRLIVLVFTLFGITVITFVVTRLAPGDPATLKLQFAGKSGRGGQQLTKKLIEQTRKIYGFDKPILLNFRNENYQTEVKKLLKTLREGDEIDRDDARVSIREVSTLALPSIFDEFEKYINKEPELQKGKSLSENYIKEILNLLPTLINQSILNEELLSQAGNDIEKRILLWMNWWKEKKDYFEGIDEQKIRSALMNKDQKRWRENLLNFGGFGVKYLINILFEKGWGATRDNDETAIRSADILSEIVKKPWGLDADKSSDEKKANFKRWKRWWKNEKTRFSTFALRERFLRAFTETQYGIWLSKILTFDFDVSYSYNRPVIDLIKERLPISIQLSLISIFISYIIAIPLGIYSSTHRFTMSDQATTVILFILYSLPSFWVASMLIMFTTGGDFPHIFPSRYLHSIGSENWDFWRRTLDWLWHLVLPVTCYTYASFAFLSRQMRSSMLEVIKQDFIRTARAKGLPERVVIFKHALRNSLIPILTLSATLLPELLGGSVIIEQIFSIDGMGRLTFEAILNRDYPIINGIFFFSALLTLLGILIADLSYAIADPRIKYD